jgi:hypothetical protein
MCRQCLEVLVKELENDPNIYVVFCRTLNCDENLEPIGSYRGDNAFILNKMDPLKRYVQSGHEWYEMCFADIQLWHSNAQMHNRQNLLDLGGWDTTWGCASDTDLVLRILEKNRMICHNPYIGILYRLRKNSVSDNFRKRGWLKWESILIHLNSLMRYYENDGKLKVALRKAWWRYWKCLDQFKNGDAIDKSTFPQSQRINMLSVFNRVRQLPLKIYLEGYLRQKLWNLRHQIS